MFAEIFNTLQQSGWKLVTLEGNWVSATHESLKRGLLLGNISNLPQDFRPLIQSYSNPSQWDVIVFCPNGIDSSDLKKNHFPGVQLWYWDIQQGNLFPFPPTNDPLIPKWLKQLANGNDVGINKRVEKQFIPFLTYIFLGINLIVFILMTLAGGSTEQRVLIAFGAKVNTLIQAGEVWRLLTSTFIHIGYLHLVFNLYALWSLGPFSEERFGHGRFFVIYIMSGLGGSIASFFFSSALSAGASGAIFGLLGSLLYYSLKRPLLWKSGFGMNLVIVILINFGFGLTQPGIDNFAHLGGLLMGIITTVLLSNQSRFNT
ncbi:rhomboid family intramembrane serine protease [Desulfosporosinus nitroreducens]|uniref:Rhomboid family intramembrane serine protease n=1 Tax=Desulfosporosinus nitroreducens TaxID=2018668 RepID=A0ABT8QN40_9FIRM|nr:rhomboid family intramembrane serine protease [Desulfosporosinus nitroreducens]MDO0821356.1 rhomboid family intramembrane serine protease [Desulfosporosinus nitroreducens]